MTEPTGAAASHLQETLLALGRLGQVISEAMVERVGDKDLVGNLPVLAVCHLEVNGPSRPTDIQRLTGLSSGGTTRLLDRLEAGGVLERAFGAVRGDRRATLVSLTPKGHEVAGQLAAALGDRRDTLRALVADVVRLLEADRPVGAGR